LVAETLNYTIIFLVGNWDKWLPQWCSEGILCSCASHSRGQAPGDYTPHWVYWLRPCHQELPGGLLHPPGGCYLRPQHLLSDQEVRIKQCIISLWGENKCCYNAYMCSCCTYNVLLLLQHLWFDVVAASMICCCCCSTYHVLLLMQHLLYVVVTPTLLWLLLLHVLFVCFVAMHIVYCCYSTYYVLLLQHLMYCLYSTYQLMLLL